MKKFQYGCKLYYKKPPRWYWFYWIKAFICCSMGRIYHGYPWDYKKAHQLYQDEQSCFTVGIWPYRQQYQSYGQDWEEMTVGKGLFNRWRVFIYSNGT